jgi:hypothetical protein
MLLLTLGCLFVASTAAAQTVEQATPIKLSDAQRRVLATGEAIVTLEQAAAVNRGVVVGVIKAPVEDVWPIVSDCGKYAEWRDSIKDTGVIRRESASVLVCKGTAVVPFPARNRYGHFRVYNRKQTVGGIESYVSTYSYLPDSGNMNDMFGYWLVQPWGEAGEHSIVKFVLNVDIGGWLPDFLVRWATGRTLPDTLYGIRMRHAQHKKIKGLSAPMYW